MDTIILIAFCFGICVFLACCVIYVHKQICKQEEMLLRLNGHIKTVIDLNKTIIDSNKEIIDFNSKLIPTIVNNYNLVEQYESLMNDISFIKENMVRRKNPIKDNK